MSWSWISENLDVLPRSGDPFFKLLWEQKRLQFNDPHQQPDAYDELNARLVCAALEKRQQLFVTLPDNQTRRPALLFSTGLIMSALDQIRRVEEAKLVQANDANDKGVIEETPVRRVLYFGSAIGIREQLGQVNVEGGMKLNLADAFQPETTVRGRSGSIKSVRSAGRRDAQAVPSVSLPKVLCVYAPADPVAVLSSHPADWIAIDCDDEPQIRWLLPLIREASEKGIPIIAWGQNPLSQCIKEFLSVGKVFQWAVPPATPAPSHAEIKTNAQVAFESCVLTQVQVTVLEGNHVHSISDLLQEASWALVQCARKSTGQLSKDALRLHWNYLRSVEALSVPLTFYEAEAPRLYGLSSFAQLKAACDRFQDVIAPTHPEVYTEFQRCTSSLEAALQRLNTEGVPLWSYLAATCKEPVNGEARILVFSSAARKRLFAFALLARYNMTEEDLRNRHIWLASLADLRQNMRLCNLPHAITDVHSSLHVDANLHWHPILVGLPSPAITSKLLPVLIHDKISVWIYPHQQTVIERRVQEWNFSLLPHMQTAASILSQLNAVPMPSDISEAAERVHCILSSSKVAEVTVPLSSTKLASLFALSDPTEEITRLLALEDDEQEDLDGTSVYEDNLDDNDEAVGDIWCDKAVQVQFEQGWQACFSPDETINVVVRTAKGQEIEERYVRSLQPDHRVVLVHGQRRQSLYDLIISRVHQHPSIELHLALVRRWREEFSLAYRKWQKYGVKNVDELLRQMQKRGSSLKSSLTLRLWLRGETLSPLDAEDLGRLAEVLDLDFVRTYYKRIHQAANRVRVLHRSTAHRLNRWLEQQSDGSVTDSDNEIIDATLNLTFGDLRNSLMMLRVVSVETIQGPFPLSSLGRIEKVTTNV